jgi:protoheme IX farnesyltransferase
MSSVPAILQPASISALRRASDYWTLTKPEVNFLVVMSSLAGFYAASRGPLDWALLIHTLAGTLLVASGTATLNQLIERDADALMRRTSLRPLPARRMPALHALLFGIFLSIAGGAYLLVAVNALACILAMSTLLTYLLIYTPLKKRTPWCTFLGAFPGAAPPLIGWAGAAGSLSRDAWVLYAILFLWQFPHFLAIAWMYRDDYARAGLKMLPQNDAGGDATMRQIMAGALLLLPVSLLPTWLGQAGSFYLAGAVLLGLMYIYSGFRLATTRTNTRARRLVLASVVYLPLVFGLLMLDKSGI